MKFRLCVTSSFAASLLLLAGPLVHADDLVWTGGGGDDKWSTAANWQAGRAPEPGSTSAAAFDTLIFSGENRQSSNADLGSPQL